MGDISGAGPLREQAQKLNIKLDCLHDSACVSHRNYRKRVRLTGGGGQSQPPCPG